MIGLNLTERVSFRPGDANEAPWTTEAEGRLGCYSDRRWNSVGCHEFDEDAAE